MDPYFKFDGFADGTRVTILDFDSASEGGEPRYIAEQAWDSVECDIDSLGKRHDAALRCPNEGNDELLGRSLCKFQHAENLSQ